MAALTPVANIEELLRAIERSALLSSDALAKVRESSAALTDPKALARALIKDGTLTRWQADQLLHNYYRLLIGKYKLLDQLETSPTGRVYLAEHVQMGRRHTLKVLAKRLASNPEAVSRFLKAAQHACGLDHKNISHVYDVSQDRLGHFVVMEYVEGQNLEQLVEKSGPLKLPQAFDFITQAADGLAHAHSHGVVHGDLKPANLLRDNNGIIKILEIGQDGAGAKPETDDADESVEMASLAAVIFQAPEMRGDGEGADVACDVYSIGSVLAFLLTGKAAKNATTAVKLLEAIPDVQPEVIALCRRLMADNPPDRPGSMEEVLAAIATAAKLASVSTNAANADDSTKAAKKKKDKQQRADAPPEIPPPPPTNGSNRKEELPDFVVGGRAPPVPLPPPADFAIKTRGRIGKKLASKSGTDATSSEGHEDGDQSSITVFGKRFTPLVLAGAIGGVAVLALGLAVLVVCFIAFGRGNTPVAKVNDGKKEAIAQPAASDVLGEAEANPPQVVADANPELPPVAAPIGEKPSSASAPAEGSSPPREPATEPPPVAATASLPNTPDPPAESKPVITEAPAAQVVAAPVKPPAAPTKKATGDPFIGFTKAVSLPPLPESADSATQSDLKPISLGPCNVDGDAPLTISLIGGETAIRTTRQKFELQPRAINTSEWEVLLSGSAMPVAIASLAAKDNELLFQWTEEAVKQSAVAKQLVNCALALGKSKHTVALRTPIKGQPLVFDIEKPGASAKWNLRDLPLAKQVFVEVTRTDGFTRQRLDPKNPINVGESVVVGTGPSDKSVPLLLKLNTSSTANSVDVRVQTTVKLEGWLEPRAYRRKDLLAMQPESTRTLTQIKNEYDTAKSKRPTLQAEKDAQKATVDRLARELASVNTLLDQLRYVVDFSGMTEGIAKIHFRVYHLAGDAKIDLLRTEDEEDSAK